MGSQNDRGNNNNGSRTHGPGTNWYANHNDGNFANKKNMNKANNKEPLPTRNEKPLEKYLKINLLRFNLKLNLKLLKYF